MEKKELDLFFKNVNENDKLNHAYLLSNVTLKNIKLELEDIIGKYYLYKSCDIESTEDIYIIAPENGVIKKEKILDLESKILLTSQINDKKIYIIDECDTLNDYSANALLKTLEEPESNIYAILLTNNLEKVLPTIKSRCQILYYEKVNEEKKHDDKIYNISISLMENLEKYKLKSIAYQNGIYKVLNKDMLEECLSIFENIYSSALKKKLNLNIEIEEEKIVEEIIKNNSLQEIVKKLKVINEIRDLLKYNLNLNLLIDRFIIDFGRC